MTEHTHLHPDVLEPHELRPQLNEPALPDLIQAQIQKLNALDGSVKAALTAAANAEKRAISAADISAGRGFLKDKKREAIEELPSAGIELAGAVQSSAQAQKMSFEFQTQLTDITKYLFTLGVSNIAANRSVVRELESRLAGASEEELSELARQEVASVIKQLKDQEDILRKQDQMMKVLKEHDTKVSHLISHQDDLEAQLRDQHAARQTDAALISDLRRGIQHQEQALAGMQQQLYAHQTRLETLALSLAEAGSHAEQLTGQLRRSLNVRTGLLVALVAAVSVGAYLWSLNVSV